MYKYSFINRNIACTKARLSYFIKNNRSGCKIYIHPYNKIWCNVDIYLHKDHRYCIILNYIYANKDGLKCSDKAKKFYNKWTDDKL